MTETPPPPAPAAPQAPVEPKQGNGLATAGMILGIICVATSWIWCFLWASLACGVVGLVLSILGQKKARQLNGLGAGKAKAGIICSIVGIAIMILVWILILTVFATTAKTGFEEFQKAIESYNQANS